MSGFFWKFCVRTKWMIQYSSYRPENTKEIEDANWYNICFIFYVAPYKEKGLRLIFTSCVSSAQDYQGCSKLFNSSTEQIPLCLLFKQFSVIVI